MFVFVVFIIFTEEVETLVKLKGSHSLRTQWAPPAVFICTHMNKAGIFARNVSLP